jgi:hypothetical protein
MQAGSKGTKRQILTVRPDDRSRRLGDSRRAERDGPLTHPKRKFKSVVRLSDLDPWKMIVTGAPIYQNAGVIAGAAGAL